MSKTRKYFFAVTLLTAASLFADQTDALRSDTKDEPVTHSMGYMQLGLGPAPIPLPVFGLGYRAQKDHNGIDLSLQVSTLVLITQVKTSALYHYYFSPSVKSQFYAGAGLGVGGLFYEKHGNNWRAKGLISPEFVFGKQYQNDTGAIRFFQAQLSFPTFSFGHISKPFYFPLVVLSYGVGF